MSQIAYRGTTMAFVGVSVLMAQLTILPRAGGAQSLGDIAKKEKKRRAENDANDVRVIRDRELSTATGEPFPVAGATTQPEKKEVSAPATSATATAKSDTIDGACVELKAVEAEIARRKKEPQFTTPSRPATPKRSGRAARNVITGTDWEGNRITESFEEPRSARGTRREKPSNHASYQAGKLAKLKSRWAELKGRCRE